MELLTEQEALVAVALCAAYADGSMGAEEDEHLTERLGGIRALRGLDERSLRAAMMKANAIAQKGGDGALLGAAAAALRPDMRATAFCLGTDLVLADAEVAEEERAFVERLRRTLGIEPALAQRIIDVILIRNRA